MPLERAELYLPELSPLRLLPPRAGGGGLTHTLMVPIRVTVTKEWGRNDNEERISPSICLT